jgi:hypothetical protein
MDKGPGNEGNARHVDRDKQNDEPRHERKVPQEPRRSVTAPGSRGSRGCHRLRRSLSQYEHMGHVAHAKLAAEAKCVEHLETVGVGDRGEDHARLFQLIFRGHLTS